MTPYKQPVPEMYRIAGLCLRAERQAKGLTQVQLSRRLGITNASLSYIERGHNRMRLDTLVQACVVLGADPVDMFARIVRMTPNVSRGTSTRDCST